jgi:hypothetical protein
MTNKKNEENEDRAKRRSVSEEKDEHHRRAAGASILYLLAALGFFCWLLFDIWIKRHSLPRLFGYDAALLDAPAYRLVAYTVIGGAIGSIVNGMRSCLLYFKGFDRQFVWKYIAAPWMGATLALFVYALIRSSVAVFGGSMSSDTGVTTPQALSNFAVGALAGYGSKDVFIWLDAQVHKIFQVSEQTPDVKGKTEKAAVSRLQSANLELGEVTRVPHKDGKDAGKVIDQSPPPEAPIDRGEAVDLIVAADKTNKNT